LFLIPYGNIATEFVILNNYIFGLVKTG